MKHRHSLVSNSSSSSFVCYRPLNEISKEMLELVESDFIQYNEDEKPKKENKKRFEEYYRRLDKALSLDEVKSGKIGIVFPSCNEDTYLRIKKDCVIIHTSWNHPWNDNIDGLDSRSTEDEEYSTEFSGVYFYDVRLDDIVSHDAIKVKKRDKAKCGCTHGVPWSYNVNRDGTKKYCTWCHQELTIG